MDYSKRNTAFLLVGAGIYLAVGHMAGFAIASAIVLALLGYVLIRGSQDEENRKNYISYALFGAAALLIVANHSGLLLLAAAAAAFWYFVNRRRDDGTAVGPQSSAPADQQAGGGAGSHHSQRCDFVKHIAASIRWGRAGEAWTARSSQISVAVAEVAIDLTNAIFEEPEITLNLQGLIGDIDIVVPEDVGLSVNAQVAVGEMRIAGERSSGLGNRFVWRSPNYDMTENRVQLQLSYAVADVNVKVL